MTKGITAQDCPRRGERQKERTAAPLGASDGPSGQGALAGKPIVKFTPVVKLFSLLRYP